MPRPRRRSHPGIALALLALAATLPLARDARAAAPAAEPEFRRHLEALVSEGTLGRDESLLRGFQRVFAPAELPEALRSDGAWPAKSVTRLIAEFDAGRDDIAPSVAEVIEGYLVPESESEALVRTTTHFAIEYRLDGADAVPAEDVAPSNGVPDLVDWVAEAGEIAWQRLVEEVGFSAPALANGRVPVSFREMEAFGYTRPIDGVPHLVLHRDFVDFPENLDPAGSLRGALKVTIAHELKHASQHAASGWTEGGWLEADATWAEDLVFDEVDDYLRYLPYGSPISHPDEWLPASYEDCLWSHLLAQTWGPGVLVDFFDRRGAHPGESVLASYDRTLAARGSALRDAIAELGIWCHLSGANASGRPVGFADAERYPTPPLREVVVDPAQTVDRWLPRLGSHQVLVLADGRTGRPRVEFVGDGAVDWSVAAVALDRGGARAVRPIPIASSATASHEVDLVWEDTVRLHLVVTRLDLGEAGGGYALSVDDRHAVGVDPEIADSRFRLEPNRPNPFRSRTSITFEIPAPGRVRLAIYDVRGRLVRRLADGSPLPAGRHEIAWPGLDEAGRRAAPGVYYYRLETDDRLSATRRMLLLR